MYSMNMTTVSHSTVFGRRVRWVTKVRNIGDNSDSFPLIQIMFVVLKRQSTIWSKYQEHGYIGLAIFYSLLASIAVKLILVYLFTQQLMRSFTYCYMSMILSSQAVVCLSLILSFTSYVKSSPWRTLAFWIIYWA